MKTDQNQVELPIDYDDESLKSHKISAINERIIVSWKISALAQEEKSCLTKLKGLNKKSNLKNEKVTKVEDVSSRTAPDGSTIILNNVTGIVKPGQLCAIMGASGAGKTTLLNVLNFRNQNKMLIEGEVKLNGQPADWNMISRCSGYVQQDDLFVGTMTVREHLSFLAFLKMGRNVTKEEKQVRIEEIIVQTNLAKAQDTYIGVPGVFKGISGGEKRRLAFASEIMTNPNLLFCDEPTSGLDAFMAIGLAEIMRKQADQGKTIICTIHQPSTQIFEKFDTLCLLSEGRVAYFGPREEAVSFFSKLSYVCPMTYNPADYFIQTLAILPDDRKKYILRSNAICDAYEISQYKRHIESEISIIEMNKNINKQVSVKNDRTTMINQMSWLLWRDLIVNLRTPIASKILVGQILIISIFIGLIYLQLGNDENGAMNKNGLLFIVMMNSGFAFIFPILNVYCAELPIYYREYKNNMYSSFAYFISKQLIELPKYVVLSFIQITIIFWMANVSTDGGVYITIALTLVLCAQTSASLGYLLSVTGESIDTGTAIAAPILIPLILFAGFFLNNSSVPSYFIWIKYLSWFFYTYDAMLIELWGNTGTISCSTGSSSSSIACSRYSSGSSVLSIYSVEKNNLGRDIGVSIAIFFFLRLLAFFVLFMKSKRK